MIGIELKLGQLFLLVLLFKAPTEEGLEKHASEFDGTSKLGMK